MYRPPDSRVEYNDRFEECIDSFIDENKEFILLGDFNKDLLNVETYREWGNFTTSLGLTQQVNEPARLTNASQTIIDHIYIYIYKHRRKHSACACRVFMFK